MKLFKMDLQLLADEATPALAVELKKPTAEELAAMSKEDLSKLKADMQATAQAAVEEVEQAIAAKEQDVEEEVESWAEQFRAKHGVSWQIAAGFIVGVGLILTKLIF